MTIVEIHRDPNATVDLCIVMHDGSHTRVMGNVVDSPAVLDGDRLVVVNRMLGLRWIIPGKAFETCTVIEKCECETRL